jgi:PKD repeat protein
MSHVSRAIAAVLAAVAALFALPALAHASFQGQEGKLVLTDVEATVPTFLAAEPDAQRSGNQALDRAYHLSGSADGQQLVAGQFTGGQPQIVVAKYDGSNVHVVPGTVDGDDPAFSPDGQTIAFVRGGRVRLIPVAGGTATALGPTIDDLHDLEWAPDGAHIAYVTGGTDEVDADLGLLDVATGTTTALTNTDGIDEDRPSWSPDGTRIAFSEVTHGATSGSIRTMAAEGGDLRTVTTEADDTDASPAWSPAGTRIAYVDDHGHVTARPVAGGPAQQIGNANEGAVDLSWLVKPGTGNKPPTADFAVSPEFPRTGAPATFTATASDPDGSVAAYAWDLDGDGQFDDGTGATAQTTYTQPGAVTVRLRVRDNLNLAATVTRTVTVVVAGKPIAFFSVSPERPATSREATFTAAVNDDPAAVVAHREWDFDGDGHVDLDTGTSRTAHWTYDNPGTYQAKLRTTDTDGDVTEHTQPVTVERARDCDFTVGRLAVAGCIEVNGYRGLARDGLTIDGLTLKAPEGTAIVLDRSAQGDTIRGVPADQAEAYLNGRGVAPPEGSFTVLASVCGEPLGAAALDLRRITDASAPQKLKVEPTPGVSIAGMNVTKLADVTFGPGGSAAEVDMEGRFPRVPLSPAASAEYELSNHCESRRLHAHTNDLLFRTIQLTDFDLVRIGGGRNLTGTLGVKLPVIDKGVHGTVTLTDGAITRLRLAADNLRNIGQALELSEVALQLRLSGGSLASVAGSATVVTRGSLFGRHVAEMNSRLSVGDDKIRFDGDMRVFGIPVGFGWMEAGLGWVDMGTHLEAHLGPAYAEMDLSGYLSVVPPGLNIEGNGRAGFKGIGSIGAAELISTKGGGICGEFGTPFGTAHPGVTFKFAENILEPRLEDLDLNIFVTGCDLGPIRVSRAASAAAAGGARAVSIPRGLPSASVQVTGRDAAPKVTFVGPDGERIATPAAADTGRKVGRFILVQDDRSRTTTVMIVKPPAGRWRVVPAEGSTAIRSVGVARGLPQPKVKARVTGRGTHRVLRWTLKRIPGQRVRLLETGRKGGRLLTVTNRARGHKRFTPAAGLSAKRRIVAFVEQGGLPRTKIAAGRYTVRVAKAPRPVAPRKASWRLTPQGLRVTFAPRAPRLAHEVEVVRADGVRRVDLVPAGRRSTTIPGLWAGERITRVTVRAVGADGRAGKARPAARAR